MKNYFKKNERTNTILIIITVILLIVYVAMVFNNKETLFGNIMLIVVIPTIMSMINTLLNKMGKKFDTYQMHIETTYKFNKGLISEDEYKKRIHDLIEIENADSYYKINNSNNRL